jgi:hypothetical protein
MESSTKILLQNNAAAANAATRKVAAEPVALTVTAPFAAPATELATPPAAFTGPLLRKDAPQTELTDAYMEAWLARSADEPKPGA